VTHVVYRHCQDNGLATLVTSEECAAYLVKIPWTQMQAPFGKQARWYY
jgi:hypothetical protein